MTSWSWLPTVASWSAILSGGDPIAGADLGQSCFGLLAPFEEA
jgi:hypothetical protein